MPERTLSCVVSRLRLHKLLHQLNDYELCIAGDLIDPQSLDVTWSCIGGLDGIVSDINESILLPFINRRFASKLVRPPKGLRYYRQGRDTVLFTIDTEGDSLIYYRLGRETVLFTIDREGRQSYLL